MNHPIGDILRINVETASLGQPVELSRYLSHVEELAGVLRSLGTSGFYGLLVEWLQTIIPNDFWFIADYSRNGKPVIHQDTWQKNDAKNFYFSNVCQFDPVFYALGNQALMPGTSISMMRAQFDIDPRYADYMEKVAHIADELMILLPRRDGTCTAICLDREDHQFSTVEVYSARKISALLAEIMELHWERLATVPRGSSHALLSNVDAGPRQDFSRRMESFSRLYGLTSRECEIVGLSLRGYPTMAIAERLGITQGAVKNHKLRLYRKLDITTERELVPLFMDQ